MLTDEELAAHLQALARHLMGPDVSVASCGGGEVTTAVRLGEEEPPVVVVTTLSAFLSGLSDVARTSKL